MHVRHAEGLWAAGRAAGSMKGYGFKRRRPSRHRLRDCLQRRRPQGRRCWTSTSSQARTCRRMQSNRRDGIENKRKAHSTRHRKGGGHCQAHVHVLVINCQGKLTETKGSPIGCADAADTVSSRLPTAIARLLAISTEQSRRMHAVPASTHYKMVQRARLRSDERDTTSAAIIAPV